MEITRVRIVKELILRLDDREVWLSFNDYSDAKMFEEWWFQRGLPKFLEYIELRRETE